METVWLICQITALVYGGFAFTKPIAAERAKIWRSIAACANFNRHKLRRGIYVFAVCGQILGGIVCWLVADKYATAIWVLFIAALVVAWVFIPIVLQEIPQGKEE